MVRTLLIHIEDMWVEIRLPFWLLPVYGEDGENDRYNVFRIEILIRQEYGGKMYLYDLVNKKKKRAPRLSHKNCTVTNPFLLN